MQKLSTFGVEIYEDIANYTGCILELSYFILRIVFKTVFQKLTKKIFYLKHWINIFILIFEIRTQSK